MARGRSRRLIGWRRLGAHLALIALIFESLISIGHARLVSGQAAAGDATSETLAYIEICTPLGVQRVSWDGQPLEADPEGSTETEIRRSPCLLCGALDSVPLACLHHREVVAWKAAISLIPWQDYQIQVPGQRRLPKLSRAPPL